MRLLDIKQFSKRDKPFWKPSRYERKCTRTGWTECQTCYTLETKHFLFPLRLTNCPHCNRLNYDDPFRRL